MSHMSHKESYCKIMNAQSSELNNASDHLVEIPLEVVLLHVNLLVSLDHILQLFLSLLSLLELKRDTEKEKET